MSRGLRWAVGTVVTSFAAAMAAVLLFGGSVRLSELLGLPPMAGLLAASAAATSPVLVLAVRTDRHGRRRQLSEQQRAALPAAQSRPTSDRVPDWVVLARQRIWNSLPTETRPLDPPHED